MKKFKGNIELETTFSNDMRHRYYLKRKYRTTKYSLNQDKLCFILINPSYADELLFDKTNMLASNIGVRQKFNEVVILNMYSLITNNTKDLKKTKNNWNDLINDKIILNECLSSKRIILAWGSDISFSERRSELLNLFNAHNLLENVFRIVYTSKNGKIHDPAHLSMYISDNICNFEIKKYGE